MEDILPTLEEWQAQGEEIALATVVRVLRSAPRPPGARLGSNPQWSDGWFGERRLRGSGRCRTGQFLVLDTGRPPYLANYGIADELGFQVGLSCGGSIDVLIEPYAPAEEWNALTSSVAAQEPALYAVGLAPEALLGNKLTILPSILPSILPPAAPLGSIAPELDGMLV